MKNIKTFMNETDIRLLVFGPPAFSMGMMILGVLIANYFPGISVPVPFIYFGLSILFFIGSFSGIAEIYKKEMPGPMGGVLKGKIAIISGAIMVIIPAIVGLVAFISIFSDVFLK